MPTAQASRRVVLNKNSSEMLNLEQQQQQQSPSSPLPIHNPHQPQPAQQSQPPPSSAGLEPTADQALRRRQRQIPTQSHR
ncbi:hypothetical protein ACLKA7_002465 [Drosophila subpalustris]